MHTADSLPVGPILEPGTVGAAIAAAIREEHPEVRVDDHGAYLRVSVPGCCRLDAARVAARLGCEFNLPDDLELVMPSFRGELVFAGQVAEWRAGKVRTGGPA
jgi:hypothetical protein